MKMTKGIKYCLTKAGYLVYRRKGLWKTTECWRNRDYRCGDWCPHFREPVVRKRKDGLYVCIRLCRYTVCYKKKYFRDYRNLDCGPFGDED